MVSTNAGDQYDVVVIGGGNAALCAAISARRAGASVPTDLSVGTVWLVQDRTAFKAAEAEVQKAAEEMGERMVPLIGAANARLVEANRGVSLPNLAIAPAYRADGSGTTFVFTSYLAVMGVAIAITWYFVAKRENVAPPPGVSRTSRAPACSPAPRRTG